METGTLVNLYGRKRHRSLIRRSRGRAEGIIALLSAVLMAGCVPVDGGVASPAGVVTASTPSRVVTRIINNSCGDSGDEESSESLSTGSVRGLKKVLNGFGIPYDEHADAFTRAPQPVTNDSDEANKERGVGYMGVEAHYPQELASGQSHSPDHPEQPVEPGSMFPNLTTEEEKYGIAMRWEYANPDLSGTAISGYLDFLRDNNGHKQYVAVHATKTDKWCICCPYDWGPALNLPTTGGGKYANGRIGGVSPQAAEDLGISGGDGPENAMVECWWVENSSQVKCGPVSDLSSLAGESESSTKASAKVTIATSVVTKAVAGTSSVSGKVDETRVSVAPASPNSFTDMCDGTGEYGDLPKNRVKYIVLQDTAAHSADIETCVRRMATASGIRPHFVIDADGRIASTVRIGKIAHHAGRAILGANDAFGIRPERDTRDDTDILADSAMDAWSVGIALVHDSYDSQYPNAQLNALDRLVSYIDQEVESFPRILSLDDWMTGDNGKADGPTQDGEAPEDSIEPLNDGDIDANDLLYAETSSTTDEASPIDMAIAAPIDGASLSADETTDTEAYESSQAGIATEGGASVSEAFPMSEYSSSRNHAGTETMADAAVAAEQGECSDGEEEASDASDADSGGRGIAKKAVEISGTAAPTEMLRGSWGAVPSDGRLGTYVSEKNRVYPGVPGWADCGRCAATAVKASGADESFPAHMNTAYQYQYMTNSPKWKRVGTLRTGDSPDSLCEPGDVLVTEGKGHIMVYVGNEAIREKYSGSTANFVEASYDAYYPYGIAMAQYSGATQYAIFRCTRPDNGGGKSSSKSSSKADSLIFIQHKTKGATGKIWYGNGGKTVECGWCSISHAIIIASGNYSLTPDSIAAKVRSKLGDAWSGYRYNVIILGKVADVFGLKHHPLDSLTTAAVRKELQNGCPVVMSASNAPFCKEDGHARIHHCHTICFFKYENGTYYAKDSAPSDGSGMCRYSEKAMQNFLDCMGTRYGGLVVGTKSTTRYHPRTSASKASASTASASTASASTASAKGTKATSGRKPDDLLYADCEEGMYTAEDMARFAVSIATYPAVQGGDLPWTDQPAGNPRMKEWWALEKEAYHASDRRGLGNYGPGSCSPWVCSIIQKFGFDSTMGTQEMKTYITQDEIGRQEMGKHLAPSGELNTMCASSMWLYMRNRPDLYEQIDVDPNLPLSDQLEPGDIISRNGGHILMYVGEDLIHEAEPSATGNCVESSEHIRLWPAFTSHSSGDVHNSYTVFRVKNQGTASDEADVDGKRVEVSVTRS